VGSQLIYGTVNLQGKAALNITLPLLEGINVVYKNNMDRFGGARTSKWAGMSQMHLGM
jgi:hypothetical protein